MLDQLKKMSNAELVAATQQMVDVWTTDDEIFQTNPRPVVELYFDKDAVYEDASFPVKCAAKGHDEICQLILDGFPGILQWRFYITNASLVGGRLAMEWYWSGIHDRKVWMGIPPRGNKFCVRGSTWVTVNDEGKVVHSVDYYDRLTMMHQLWHEQPAEVPAEFLKKPR